MISVGYASLFPVLNIAGGFWTGLSIVLFIPFLPIAWMLGMGTASILSNPEFGYMLGATLAIAMQCFALLSAYRRFKKWLRAKKSGNRRRAESAAAEQ